MKRASASGCDLKSVDLMDAFGFLSGSSYCLWILSSNQPAAFTVWP